MALKIMQQPWLWKRFTTNAIDSYVGVADEIVLDLRYSKPVLRVMDGVTAGGTVIESTVNPGVRTPEITGPSNGAVDISTAPIITANAFFGLKGDLTADTHASSQWQIATDAGFSNVVYDSGADSTNKTSIDLSVEGVSLPEITTVYARVRYFGQSGDVSAYSNTVMFTTKALVPVNLINSDVGYFVYNASNDGNRLFRNVGRFGLMEYNGSAWNYYPGTVGISTSYGASYSMSADGNRGIIGNGSEVNILSYSGSGNWNIEGDLFPDNPQSSPGIQYGVISRLSSDGSIAYASSPLEQVEASNISTRLGVIYRYTRTGTTWTKTHRLSMDATHQTSSFNIASISPDGRYLLAEYAVGGIISLAIFIDGNLQKTIAPSIIPSISNPFNSMTSSAVDNAGNVFIGIGGYNYVGMISSASNWTTSTDIASAAGLSFTSSNSFGYSVDVTADGNRLAVGDRGQPVGANNYVGRVYLFGINGSAVTELGQINPTVTTENLMFGSLVHLSDNGQILVVSASDRFMVYGSN